MWCVWDEGWLFYGGRGVCLCGVGSRDVAGVQTGKSGLASCTPSLHTPPRPCIPPSPPSACPTQSGDLSVLEETELKAGKFGVIRSLLRALDGGATAKAVLDAAIDACSAMQVGAWGWRVVVRGRRDREGAWRRVARN